MQPMARRRSVTSEPVGVSMFMKPAWRLHRSLSLPATASATTQPDSSALGGPVGHRHTAGEACAAPAVPAHAHRRQWRSRRTDRALQACCGDARAHYARVLHTSCACGDSSRWPATGRLPRAVSCVGGAAPPPQPTGCGGDYFFRASEGARQPRQLELGPHLSARSRSPTHACDASQPPALPFALYASPLQPSPGGATPQAGHSRLTPPCTTFDGRNAFCETSTPSWR